jgi:putative sigma-54 modulation protein
MSIKFTSKNVKLPGALKAFTEQNLENIAQISGDIIGAEVIVSEEKLDYKVEITLKTKLHSYHIEESDPIMKQAIRATLKALKAQAKKNKEKLKKEKKRRNKNSIIKRFIGAKQDFEAPVEAAERNITDTITVSENFSRKPLSVEEALFFLKESGENAYMFPNVETDKMSVIFYDDRKNVSIIESV